MSYDIIADIHGHAEELKALLRKLGYLETVGAWRHPSRQVIFVGDFIDRGPQQVETVEVARRMVDGGSALAVMGNHELNAIAYALPDPRNPGEYLRPHWSHDHLGKNRNQHEAFLAEVAFGSATHVDYIDWFLTLPLWLELPGLRVVHACWHQGFLDYLQPQLAPGNLLTRELMPAAAQKPGEGAELDGDIPTVFKAVETLTKGIEVPLPPPHYFHDKDGNKRYDVRVRWWDQSATTFRTGAILEKTDPDTIPDLPLPPDSRIVLEGDAPVFFGHYWLTGMPVVQSPNAACLDYSVAKQGKLVAYRWDGESTPTSDKLVWVDQVRARDP